MLLTLLLGICPVSSLATRSQLRHAREVCAAVATGTTRAAALGGLSSDLEAIVIGYSGTMPRAPSVELGRRGALVSWGCDVSFDAHDTVVGTRFEWWVTIDFHGAWDDDARAWLEAHFL